MAAHGCVHSYPSTDPVHFDCPGADLAGDNIRTFQHLWNLNHPTDRIAEDGAYGPQTESRLVRSPAAGFAIAGDCPATCTRHCDGAVLVAHDCSRTSCGSGATCTDDSLSVRCTSLACPARGTTDVCLADGRRAHCVDGTLSSPTRCAAGTTCMGRPATCVASIVSVADAGTPPRDLGVAAHDSGMSMVPMTLPDAGTRDAGDAGRAPDAEPDDAPAPIGPLHHAAVGGCSIAPGHGGLELALGGLLVLAMLRRRRHR